MQENPNFTRPSTKPFLFSHVGGHTVGATDATVAFLWIADLHQLRLQFFAASDLELQIHALKVKGVWSLVDLFNLNQLYVYMKRSSTALWLLNVL